MAVYISRPRYSNQRQIAAPVSLRQHVEEVQQSVLTQAAMTYQSSHHTGTRVIRLASRRRTRETVAKKKVTTTAAKMSGFLSATIVRAYLDMSTTGNTILSLPQKKKAWNPRARYLNPDDRRPPPPDKARHSGEQTLACSLAHVTPVPGDSPA